MYIYIYEMAVDQPSDEEDILPMINAMQSTINRLSGIPKKIIFLALTVVSLIATITSLSVTFGKVPTPPTAVPITAMPTTAMPTTAMPTTAVPITMSPTRKKTAYPTTAMPTFYTVPTGIPTTKPTRKKGG
jgi:hypothetical protein